MGRCRGGGVGGTPVAAEPRPRRSSPENYAQHWCSLLTDPAGAFSSCHSVINPGPFHSVRPPASPCVGWGAGGRTCPTPGSSLSTAHTSVAEGHPTLGTRPLLVCSLPGAAVTKGHRLGVLTAGGIYPLPQSWSQKVKITVLAGSPGGPSCLSSFWGPRGCISPASASWPPPCVSGSKALP